MSLEATVADPLTEPAPAGWDAFAAAQRLPPVWRSGPVATADWFSQVASSLVLVRESQGGTPVAAFHARHVGSLGLRRFHRPGRPPRFGLTECRINPNISPGYAFADQLDDADRAEACRVFERELRRRTGFGQRAFAYRYLLTRDLSVLPAAGRLTLRLSPHLVLDNQWSDVPSYLRSLPGKWRSQLKKIHQTIREDEDLRVAVVDSIDPAEACWLAEVVRRRHLSPTVPRPPWPARYFAQLAAQPDVRFITYRCRAGRLLSYIVFCDDGDQLTLIWWGTRGEQDGRRPNLYFDQYLRLAELMIGQGRGRLVLGAGMAEIKARYGARPEPRWGRVGLW